MSFLFKFEGAEHKVDCARLKDAVGALRAAGFDPQEVVDCINLKTNESWFKHFCRGYEDQRQREGELSCALAELDDKQMTEVFVSPAKEVFLRLNHNPEFVTVRHLIEGYEWNVPTDDFLNNWTCK